VVGVASFGQRPADWVAVALGGAIGLALAYAALFQVGTDGVSIGIALISALVTLAAVCLLWLLTRSGIVRGLAAGVAAGWMLLIIGMVLPSASPTADPDQVEARLRQIASSTDTPIYYLGPSYNGMKLSGVAVGSGGEEAVDDNTLDAGQELVIFYGEACSGNSCASKIEIVINPRNTPDPTRDVRLCLQGTAEAAQLSEAAKALRLVQSEAGDATAPAPLITPARVGLC
jgi:hypothetical protein